MALSIINESLFHLLSDISSNAQNILTNLNSDIIISLEESKVIHIVKEKDKVINKQKNTINKLIYILDVIQNKIIDKDTKINELKEVINDKIKLTEILTKQIISKDDTTIIPISSENMLCNACMENTKTYLYQPCMHLCYCENCSEKADKHICPICRTQNAQLTKIYYN
jgi:hypothetical protein